MDPLLQQAESIVALANRLSVLVTGAIDNKRWSYDVESFVAYTTGAIWSLRRQVTAAKLPDLPESHECLELYRVVLSCVDTPLDGQWGDYYLNNAILRLGAAQERLTEPDQAALWKMACKRWGQVGIGQKTSNLLSLLTHDYNDSKHGRALRGIQEPPLVFRPQAASNRSGPKTSGEDGKRRIDVTRCAELVDLFVEFLETRYAPMSAVVR